MGIEYQFTRSGWTAISTYYYRPVPISIERGPGAMDYDNIMILWRSPCQYDPTGYRENIADTVLLSAHFIPSCSDIAIKSPKDKWVLNTNSLVQGGQPYLPITIDQFRSQSSGDLERWIMTIS